MQYKKITNQLELSLEQQTKLLSTICNNFQNSKQCSAKIIGLPECPHYYTACEEIDFKDWEFFLKDGYKCASWSHLFKG